MNEAILRALNKFALDHVMAWAQLETLNTEFIDGAITQERFAKRVSEIITEHEKEVVKQKAAMEAKAGE